MNRDRKPMTPLEAQIEPVEDRASVDATDVDLADIGRQIRLIRKRRQLTLEEVATAAGMTAGYVSQIERGLAVPTLVALKRVAASLGVRLADFFRSQELASPYGLIRRAERPRFRHPMSGQLYQQLTPTWSGRMVAALYSLQPGAQTERMSHAGEEFVFVLTGEIEYRIGDQAYRMAEGDSLYFDCFQPHSVINVGETDASWIWGSVPAF